MTFGWERATPATLIVIGGTDGVVPEGDIELIKLGLNLVARYSELALAWGSFDSDLFDSA